MRFGIITIGSELTLGYSIDTNTAYIARSLGQDGHLCSFSISIGDNVDLIVKTIHKCLEDVDGLIITGGLGPTQDDLTVEALSRAFDLSLEYHPEIEKLINVRFGKRHQIIPDIAFRQAYAPSGAHLLVPRLGSAPGIVLDAGGKFVISLPGVPSEMQDMIEHDIKEWLSQNFPQEKYYGSRVIKTDFQVESELQATIQDLVPKMQNTTIGIIASPGEVQLQLVSWGLTLSSTQEHLERVVSVIKERLEDNIVGYDEDSIASVVGSLLQDRGLTCSTAESCTGGLVSKLLTDIPGSSKYFLGGIVSYSDRIKQSDLGVLENILREYGAVSSHTALAMARGVRNRHDSDIGISTTGIAGPGGGSPEKPVGLVYLGLCHGMIEISKRHIFYGSRDVVRIKSSITLLNMLRCYILKSTRGCGGD